MTEEEVDDEDDVAGKGEGELEETSLEEMVMVPERGVNLHAFEMTLL